MKRIAVTGGAGQIAYSLLFRIASGELLGPQQPLALHILEIPEAFEALKGVRMELEDCAFPLLKEIKIGVDPQEVFSGVDYAFLIGAKPRGPGMERKDLLKENSKIFVTQGKAMNEVAPHALVFVVGNPCNTNCLIALKHASQMKPSQFYAMTRLDQNRASFLLAQKARVPISEVSHVIIWGNHSSTQVPDFINAKIGNRSFLEVVPDRKWAEEVFVPQVQKRGAAVIAARGKSSAASAANAALEGMKSLIFPTPQGEWFSCSLFSDGNSYGIHPGIFFSFPCISKGNGKVEIVKQLPWDDFLKRKMAETEKELLEERDLIREFL